MKLADIIKNYRLEHGMSMDNLSTASGLSKPYISMLEKNKNSRTGNPIIPSLRTLQKLAKGMNITLDKLLENMDTTQKVSISNDQQSAQSPLPSFEYRNYPAGIAAGALEEIDAIDNVPMVAVPDAWLGKYARNRNIVFMHVNGESMNKIIQNGATIAVLININLDTIHNGDVVVAQNCHGEYTVKHFYDDADNDRFILRPDSSDPSFTDMIFNYDDADEMKIFGKVVIYSVYL
ncbi:XRE family transcriptional regulator [Megasphaera cerevisiae]|uniref:XRE family transcriptional regulator n=1 Tax=Megasphaera cerevisiae TaxID=39029 RepID=UPI00065A9676|nr:S24 family peptidase [Megasphaera cerevisiae]SKA25315.1 repressor LexA [Megasphaera cerevisiae DSM 20462]